ncbi:unnamed protein product [Ostreobium quekettii]|uniref:PET hydrolase/cutinase-like domain-containing protein n=1 Tax=Ostreobium quekettii TaxID=121088 RepID=A0A8S1IKV1_9CHLO|nr:unnamed protein product [Ostreobium quekettii]|eukprot:evm.model.scf_58.6 EVM.evm.TU.scf_58.6   scf_58:59402-64748(+)
MTLEQVLVSHEAPRAGAQSVADRALLEDASSVSFKATEEGLRIAVEAKPYGDVILQTRETACSWHLTEVLPASCGPELDDATLCCAAVAAFVDEGQCLCQPRLHFLEDVPFVQQILELGVQCGVEFPLPPANESLLSLRGLEQCRPFLEDSPLGKLTPEFIGLTEEELAALGPEELPTFDDLYSNGLNSIFPVGNATANITRPQPSVLINPQSTQATFNALVLYPESLNSTFAPFPVIAFAPGLGVPPFGYIRTLRLLASQGFIVVSPLSTEFVSGFGSLEDFKAYGADVAVALQWAVAAGADGESFLLGAVDGERVGIMGHSMGGAMILEAAVVAQQNFSLHVDGVFGVSPICTLGACDLPYEAAMKLEETQVKFLVGEFDGISPPSHSQLFESLLPESTGGEVVVLEGGTHCFGEVEPEFWAAFNAECGKGTISPFEQIREWQMQAWLFFESSLR